jgi:hypothetical protein
MRIRCPRNRCCRSTAPHTDSSTSQACFAAKHMNWSSCNLLTSFTPDFCCPQRGHFLAAESAKKRSFLGGCQEFSERSLSLLSKGFRAQVKGVSSPFSWISTAGARSKRKGTASLGKIRITWVRRFNSWLSRSAAGCRQTSRRACFRPGS